MNNIIYSTEQNQYSYFEKHSPSPVTRICIDRTVTGCGKCIGYCKFDGHQGFLTQKLMREHNCLKKNCFYFVRKPKKEKNLKNH